MRILITGGSSEIGFAIAHRRVKMGDEVIITSSSPSSLERTLTRYRELDLNVSGIVLDLENPEASSDSMDRVCLEGIQGLVLNAATEVRSLKRFHEISKNDYEKAIQSNVQGNLWVLQNVIRSMLENRFGRLVFVSSASAVSGTSRYGVYCLTKTALEGLFLNLAVDYGEFNIFANCVRPGIITTKRNEKFWKRGHFVERMKEIIPAQKLGIPSQVAEALDPLLSPTSYINGTTLTMSGGLPLVRSEGILKV